MEVGEVSGGDIAPPADPRSVSFICNSIIGETKVLEPCSVEKRGRFLRSMSETRVRPTCRILKAESPTLALHRCVEMVLDGVVGSARHELGHFSPLGAKLLEQLEDEFVLLGCERGLVN